VGALHTEWARARARCRASPMTSAQRTAHLLDADERVVAAECGTALSTHHICAEEEDCCRRRSSRRRRGAARFRRRGVALSGRALRDARSCTPRGEQQPAAPAPAPAPGAEGWVWGDDMHKCQGTCCMHAAGRGRVAQRGRLWQPRVAAHTQLRGCKGCLLRRGGCKLRRPRCAVISCRA
jgi:hypothetical protein